MRTRIQAFIYSLKQNFHELLTLRVFKNFILVGIRAKTHSYPFKVALKSGKSIITVYNQNHLQLLKYDQSIVFDNVTNSFRINKNEKSLIFYGAENNGDLPGIFYLHEYDSLEIEGKLVIDIGANIGDLSVYFASRKAEKVLAIEPNKSSYQNLLKNIRANLMDNFIFPFNAVLGCGCGFANTVNLTDISGTLFDGVQSTSEPDRESIPVKDINKILSKLSGRNVVLKIDCEGCKYDLIRCIEDTNYSKIDQIFLEFHFGQQDLPTILKRHGFSVFATKETVSYVNGAIGCRRVMGKIFARRREYE